MVRGTHASNLLGGFDTHEHLSKPAKDALVKSDAVEKVHLFISHSNDSNNFLKVLALKFYFGFWNVFYTNGLSIRTTHCTLLLTPTDLLSDVSCISKKY